MKQKLSAVVFLLFIVSTTFQIKGQASLWVNQTNGQQQQIELSKLKTITYEGNDLSLNFTDHSSNSYNLSSVRTLTFTGIQASGISTLANAAKRISLYPTVAKEQIYLTNLPDKENPIVIFRTDGTVVMQTRLSDLNEPIRINNFQNGFYLLKVNNQILKFYKQ